MDESSNIGGIIQSKIIIAAAAAVIIAVAGIAAIAVLGNDDGQDKTFNPYDSDSVRLKILGNADGSDAIDSDDVDLINRIIEANSDEDETKHIDWKTQYPFADADNDGDVDADDAALVQKFINKESAKMYYLNYYGNVTYVNYPVGQHIGAEYLQLQILPIIHSYSMLTAIDTTTPTMYGDSMFPGITKLESLGNWREITVETMTKLNSEGKLDTLLQWTGGQNSDYLWDKAYESGIADKVSIVIVPCQGPRCIEGILEVACMLGDQSLSDDYREWYDSIIDSFSGITEKKTVTAVRGYSTDQSTIAAFGSEQGPALWFNEIINFQEAYVGKTNFTSLGYEGFSSSATDEVIVMFQKPASVTYEGFNNYVEEIYKALFPETSQYKNQTLYAISFEIMPYAAGPAGCYILASYLYPDMFDTEKALDCLQEYLDSFGIRSGANARQGYTYTGSGYGTS